MDAVPLPMQDDPDFLQWSNQVLEKRWFWLTGFKTSNSRGWADRAGERGGVAVLWLEPHHLSALTETLDHCFPQHHRHSEVGLTDSAVHHRHSEVGLT